MARKPKTPQTPGPKSTAKSKQATQRPEAQAEPLPATEATPTTEAAAVAGTPASEPAPAETPATSAATTETATSEAPSASESPCPNCQAATPQLRPSGFCSDWCEQEAAGREPPRPARDRDAEPLAAPASEVPFAEASTPRSKPVSMSVAAPKKLSAIDAAARVLAETGQSMNCQALIAAMAEKGYWTSPAGRTPAATLYAALLKEITTKGEHSRFRKVERGLFARNG